MVTKRLAGWTLVEVLSSMAIVFILTGTVAHVGGRHIDTARRLAARRQIEALEIALEMYALDCGDYPTEAQVLEALRNPPVVHPVPAEWNGPYIDGPVPATPWGGEYRYAAPGPEGTPYAVTYEEDGARTAAVRLEGRGER